MKGKSVFDKFKPYFRYSKLLKESDPTISARISLFAIENLKDAYKQNKNVFSDDERKTFMAEISEYNQIKDLEMASQ